jgi:hypothetical protein
MFFDCLNVRSTTEYNRKNKPFLVPFRSADDDRFGWLQKTFLGYLHSWKASIDSRSGNFSPDARGKMFISLQTYQGFQITTYSVIEATKFLLSQGVEFIPTERFCQYPVEEYFGNQRKLGRRCDNPDMQVFGYNANVLYIQRSVSCTSGNTKGCRDKTKAWENVVEDKLPKEKETKNKIEMKKTMNIECQ